MRVSMDTNLISNFSDAMRTIKNLIELSFEYDITFVSAYPGQGETASVNLPIITYKIYEKVPGRFNTVSEIKPRIRDVVNLTKLNIPDGHRLSRIIKEREEADKGGVTPEPTVETIFNNDRAVEIWGQMFDYTIEFEVWASSGDEADKVAADFQDFMNKYTGYLQSLGIDRILFKSLSQGDPNNRWRTDLISRSMFYHFRLDEITGVKIPLINDILVDEPVLVREYKVFLEIMNLLDKCKNEKNKEE